MTLVQRSKKYLIAVLGDTVTGSEGVNLGVIRG